jgi:acyl-CoA synthetase (AMP-forming)/AMP-acid ligase II
MQSETLFHLLAGQARSTPDAIALEALDQQPLCYAALLAQIERMATLLAAAGIERNDRVVVVLPNGPEMATACLGISAVASCAPLNPEYRAREFEHFLSVLDARALLTEAGLKTPAREIAQTRGIPIIEISRGPVAGQFELDRAATGNATGTPTFALADDIALVLHTSGTTSLPKIVPLSQRNLCTSAANVVRSLALTSRDRALNMMPLFHVGGLVDLLIAPLSVGGVSICTANFTAHGFSSCVERLAPTWYQGVPTMLRDILTLNDREPALAEQASLRFIRSVSAALPETMMAEVERAFGSPVIEIYGMTESAGVITSSPLPPAERKVGSVGVSAGTEVDIVDADGKHVVAGETGEVAIRGANVMAGYEDLENEDVYHFGDGWLRTGDQGRLDADGHLFLTGRIKEIINRGGEKISPREVDEVLLRNPAVAEAATFAIPHPTLGEDVAAAIVLKSETSLNKRELTAFAAERLAYFKVPRAVYIVAELPTGPGGKLKRGALTQQLANLSPGTGSDPLGSVAPKTPIARVLAELWTEALGIESIGIYDDFFDLGGDSLKAANLANKVRERWAETIYVSAIFDAPSIAELEVFLGNQYPTLVAKMLGQRLTPDHNVVRSRVNEMKRTQLRKEIAPAVALAAPPARKNPPAIFVLSTPRSGSTLLRVMLGGHSKLFAPPELFLLSFGDLAQRSTWHSGKQQSLLEGNLRGLMQLRGLDVEQAQDLMQQLEASATTTERYYAMLQEWAGERTLVDKTPWNAVHPVAMERAEASFEDALYIHLVRHPYGMIRSFEEARLAQLWYPRLLDSHQQGPLACPYAETELAEMVWMELHENIRRFLAGIPQSRQIRVRFEDLVSTPETSMQRLGGFLGLEFEAAMLEPQANQRERMTDGLHANSRMIGDMKFHQHDGISSEAADLWKSSYDFDFLSDEAWELAEALDYSETIASANDREEFEI